mgnify:CR=1 FL=1
MSIEHQEDAEKTFITIEKIGFSRIFITFFYIERMKMRKSNYTNYVIYINNNSI